MGETVTLHTNTATLKTDMIIALIIHQTRDHMIPGSKILTKLTQKSSIFFLLSTAAIISPPNI